MQCTIYKQSIRSKKISASILEMDELMARIQTDERRRRTVEAFRRELKDLPPSLRSQTLERLPRICPGKVIRRRRDGSQRATYTGIVLIEMDNINRDEDKGQLKALATSWPTTMAVVEGANGKSIRILVRGTYEDGSLPADDAEQAERFHQELYRKCAVVYASVLGAAPKPKEAHIDDTFAWTYDPSPYFDKGAAAVKVSRSAVNTGIDGQREAAQEYGPASSLPSMENDGLWRRRFALAVKLAGEKAEAGAEAGATGEAGAETGAALEGKGFGGRTGEGGRGRTGEGEPPLLQLETVALEALRLGIPQEECVRQASLNVRWGMVRREQQRAIVESVYLENGEQLGCDRSHTMQEVTYRLQAFMQARYDLRFNVLTNGVEWRRNDAASFTFQPLDTRVMNTMIQECHESGLNISDRDMKRYLGSTRIRDYHIAQAYLSELTERWDGTTDYIGAMADRVPCRNPWWREWFHTWFLGMVKRWSGGEATRDGAVVPLLIGQQGCGKSTFAQQLLPPELREAGYRELVDFTNKAEAERMLTSALLINFDEYHQVSEKIQHGFLKNLMRRTSVKGRRPYSTVTQDMPRFAAFVATTTQADVLGDARGGRRFIVADIRDGAVIDNQQPYNYDAMFAQALEELRQGRRYYFTPGELREMETYNATYNAMCAEVSRFLDVFEPMTVAEDGCKKMKLSDIVKAVTQRTGFAYSDRGFNCLGRWLTNEARCGRLRRTMSNGCPHYLLKVL